MPDLRIRRYRHNNYGGKQIIALQLRVIRPTRKQAMVKRLIEASNGTGDPAENGCAAMIRDATEGAEPAPPASSASVIAAMRHDPAAIRRLFESGEYPYRTAMRTAPYEAHMLELQRELLKAQRWVEKTGQRIVMLFEGRDAAGKGGTIKRFTEHMNPRTARTVALQKPTERQRSEWYFQRYIAHLPAAGEIVMFDRSWYNRAGVERVMGFCSPNEYL